MTRKSGLADSPFFQPTAAPNEEEATVFQAESEREKSQENPKRLHVNKSTSKQVHKSPSKQVYMYTFLQAQDSKPTSFRLPSNIMEKFDDIFYQTNREHKGVVKRYAIVVAALALFFWDFEQNGSESEFYKLLIAEHSDVNK